MSTQEVLYEELAALCRRLRLKYVREELREVAITARAQRWDPAEMLRVLLGACSASPSTVSHTQVAAAAQAVDG
ncbi:MAG: hypothetical protein M0000_07430 [Actinomycetota bacterium]|nr:hypothetical protein [Actinomycetota bacterium]